MAVRLIRLGRYREVVGELETAVERANRCGRGCAGSSCRRSTTRGRQADALGLYRRTRADLIERLGLEPSPSCAGWSTRSSTTS
ncbi:BTAD domain-containing putative transcriptional regulator [Lentzea sp. E54]|uniref:BTAD domain-containing putative transcriptional regulator n=1 Tax=Lentzea xerophila TaxID=3435883 RepID=UPI003DA37F89